MGKFRNIFETRKAVEIVIHLSVFVEQCRLRIESGSEKKKKKKQQKTKKLVYETFPMNCREFSRLVYEQLIESYRNRQDEKRRVKNHPRAILTSLSFFFTFLFENRKKRPCFVEIVIPISCCIFSSSSCLSYATFLRQAENTGGQ